MKRGHITDEHKIKITTSINYINQIMEKIKSGDDADVENSGRRPIRELLQNSDDAESSFLVLRFDKDRLWLYNDGFSMQEKYLSALSILGGASKKEDPNTSGTFGTGFRATHMFTDTPEVEWSQWIDDDIGIMEDYRFLTFKTDDWAQIVDRTKLPTSSFMQHSAKIDTEKLGVFFSFPWRTENKTVLSDFDEYLWDTKRIEELAIEIKQQAASMLMGCRHIEKIRVILTCAESEKDNFIFEVSSDTSLSQIHNSKSQSGTVKLIDEHFGLSPKLADLNHNGAWKRDCHLWYLDDKKITSPNSKNQSLYYWSKKAVYRNSALLDDYGNIDVNSKRYWNLVVMFFPISTVHRKLPIYTPIPLGGVSNEFFGIVAFCPPDENRLKIAENSNKVKKFIVNITQTAIELYSEQIYSVVELILKDKSLSSREKEQIIVRLFPRGSASTWLSNGVSQRIQEAQNNPSTKPEGTTGNLWDALEKITKRLPIACIDGEMKLLKDTIHTIPKTGDVLDSRLSQILQSTKRSVLSETWSEYYSEVKESNNPQFRKYVWENYFECDVDFEFFGSRAVENLERFVEVVGECLDDLTTNDLATNRLQKDMLDLTENPPDGWNNSLQYLSKLFILRDAEGKLHSVDDAIEDERIIIPNAGQALLEPYVKMLIGEKYLLHSTLKSESIKALEQLEKFDQLKLNATRMIWVIDKSTILFPEQHDNLAKYPQFHEAASKLLSNAVSNGLSRSSVRGRRFVPVLRNKRIQTLEENTLEGGNLIWDLDPQVNHKVTSQTYHREFIFAPLNNEETLLLPEILQIKLRFLKLHQSISSDDEKKIIGHFSILKAVNSGKPLNLVRVLLIEKFHGKQKLKTDSLFKIDEFSNWWMQSPLHQSTKSEASIPSKIPTPKNLTKLKLEFLLYLLEPYKTNLPEKEFIFSVIKEVPYLLSVDGEWITPKDASTCSDKKLLKSIGNTAKGLHPDIVSGLGEKILTHMGVSGSIKISQARKLMEEIDNDMDLSNSLLHHFLQFLDFEDDEEIAAYNNYAEAFSSDDSQLLWAPQGFDSNSYCTAAPETILWPDEKYGFLRYKFIDNRAIPDELDEERKDAAIKFFGFQKEVSYHHIVELLMNQGSGPARNSRDLFLNGYGTSEDLDDFQRYVSKNSIGKPDLNFFQELKDEEYSFTLQKTDGKPIEIEFGVILTTLSKKEKWSPFFRKNKFIQILSHDEVVGGRGFCQKLIDCGIAIDEPEPQDLVFELQSPNIEPHICKQIWKQLENRSDDDYLTQVIYELKPSELYFEHKNSVYDLFTQIAINNDSTNPLLGLSREIIEVKKLGAFKEKLFTELEVLDLRNITYREILNEAIENGHINYHNEEKAHLEYLISNTEQQLFALLKHGFNSYELINSERINQSIMLEKSEYERFEQLLLGEEIPVLCKINNTYNSRLEKRATLFSRCKPDKKLELNNVNATPNSAMSEALVKILLDTEESGLEISPELVSNIKNLEVKMIQNPVPQYLKFTYNGSSKTIRLAGQDNAFQTESGILEFYLSQDRARCNSRHVSNLVVDSLFELEIIKDADARSKLITYINTLLQEESDSLFESNNARDTSRHLLEAYMGCQVESCGRYTPISEHSKETAERRKSFLGAKSTFYSWKQSVDSNYPIGQNVWLCPRHHTLWERGLIRFNGLEVKLSDTKAKEILPPLQSMASDFDESTLDIKIYDGGGRSFDAKWNNEKLLTRDIEGKNHGKSILEELTKWVQDRTRS